jgi:predicted Co/Zn/Cd cation transporter (cation efflux family)
VFGDILVLSGLRLIEVPDWALVLGIVASLAGFALWFFSRRLGRRSVAELS